MNNVEIMIKGFFNSTEDFSIKDFKKTLEEYKVCYRKTKNKLEFFSEMYDLNLFRSSESLGDKIKAVIEKIFGYILNFLIHVGEFLRKLFTWIVNLIKNIFNGLMSFLGIKKTSTKDNTNSDINKTQNSSDVKVKVHDWKYKSNLYFPFGKYISFISNSFALFATNSAMSKVSEISVANKYKQTYEWLLKECGEENVKNFFHDLSKSGKVEKSFFHNYGKSLGEFSDGLNLLWMGSKFYLKEFLINFIPKVNEWRKKAHFGYIHWFTIHSEICSCLKAGFKYGTNYIMAAYSAVFKEVFDDENILIEDADNIQSQMQSSEYAAAINRKIDNIFYKNGNKQEVEILPDEFYSDDNILLLNNLDTTKKAMDSVIKQLINSLIEMKNTQQKQIDLINKESKDFLNKINDDHFQFHIFNISRMKDYKRDHLEQADKDYAKMDNPNEVYELISSGKIDLEPDIEKCRQCAYDEAQAVKLMASMEMSNYNFYIKLLEKFGSLFASAMKDFSKCLDAIQKSGKTYTKVQMTRDEMKADPEAATHLIDKLTLEYNAIVSGSKQDERNSKYSLIQEIGTAAKEILTILTAPSAPDSFSNGLIYAVFDSLRKLDKSAFLTTAEHNFEYKIEKNDCFNFLLFPHNDKHRFGENNNEPLQTPLLDLIHITYMEEALKARDKKDMTPYDALVDIVDATKKK